MHIQNLNQSPIQVTTPRSAIELIHIANNTGGSVFVKIYERLPDLGPPDSSTYPDFSWQINDGVSEVIPVAQDFLDPCYIAASTTGGASLDLVSAGLDINLSIDDRVGKIK